MKGPSQSQTGEQRRKPFSTLPALCFLKSNMSQSLPAWLGPAPLTDPSPIMDSIPARCKVSLSSPQLLLVRCSVTCVRRSMLPTLLFHLTVSGGLSPNVELDSSAKPLTSKLQEPTRLLLSAGVTHAHPGNHGC